MAQENNLDQGEYRATAETQTGFIAGETFDRKAVEYSLVEGIPIFEGDIILDLIGEEGEPATRGVGITGFRWTDGLVPYQIDPSLPNQARVHDAVTHWKDNTIIRFIERTASNAAQYPNYVQFVPSTGCASYVGMRGGMQQISLASGCTTGNTIHEIGHAVGLWHEQSREDRNDWITVHYDHIRPGYEQQFNQHITDGDDIGSYDYASIMHYRANAFTKDGQPTMTTKGGEPIGQRLGLSAGDIAAVWHMYHSLVEGEQVMSMKFASGSTTPGATNWINYGANGIYVDIDTSAAGFTDTPKYFTSIEGNSNHWTTTGATSIYSASATGFRVFVHKGGVTPAYANDRNWHINWLAVGQ